jgi:YHS domain-containing protein
MNRELLDLAADLSRRHEPFLTATVVWARGPSSGKRGSPAIIRHDWTVHGWIGGACAEPVVCNMEVDVATARWVTPHAGQTFYFCAPGCRAAFERSPAEFVSA